MSDLTRKQFADKFLGTELGFDIRATAYYLGTEAVKSVSSPDIISLASGLGITFKRGTVFYELRDLKDANMLVKSSDEALAASTVPIYYDVDPENLGWQITIAGVLAIAEYYPDAPQNQLWLPITNDQQS